MHSSGVWGTEENGYKGAGVLLTYHIFMMLWMWSVVFNTSFTIMAHTVAQWFYTIQSPQAPRYSRDRAEIGPRSGRDRAEWTRFNLRDCPTPGADHGLPS